MRVRQSIGCSDLSFNVAARTDVNAFVDPGSPPRPSPVPGPGRRAATTDREIARDSPRTRGPPGAGCSVRTGQVQFPLGDVVHDLLLADRRDPEEARLAEEALHLILGRVSEPA